MGRSAIEAAKALEKLGVYDEWLQGASSPESFDGPILHLLLTKVLDQIQHVKAEYVHQQLSRGLVGAAQGSHAFFRRMRFLFSKEKVAVETSGNFPHPLVMYSSCAATKWTAREFPRGQPRRPYQAQKNRSTMTNRSSTTNPAPRARRKTLPPTNPAGQTMNCVSLHLLHTPTRGRNFARKRG